MSFTRRQHSRDKNDTNLMLFFWAIALFIGRSHFFKVAITRKTLYPALTQALQENYDFATRN
ncbi:hypothetical protein [Fortiea contorta]|uniref:hypothetical protein n=1 Tax=Fortiea contorta TaxID=1892405 RepID=UPI0003492BAF|nr:hypothetical protein [Fortiea contorta]